MHVLFLTNYYPPSALGGYEMWCQEVAQRLVERGHRITVVTSDDGRASAIEDGVEVRRALDLEVRGGALSTIRRVWDRKRRAEDNTAALQRIVEEASPDAALAWGMWNMPRETPQALETALGSRVAYYFCDYWTSLPSSYLQQLSNPARTLAGRLTKGVAALPALWSLRADAPVELALENPICTSRAVKRILLQKGVEIGHAKVVHGGVCTKRFQPAPDRAADSRLRLLYLGRINADKGVPTAVEAMRLVAEAGRDATLDLYGRGEADFLAALEAQVARHGLGKHVRFRGAVTASSTPALLSSYDGLVFPSEWDEPFARTVLEAMASGLAVVGTTTGGTGEILEDGQTGLRFQAGDASSLARAIGRLAGDRDLATRLGATARQVVVQRHDLSRMVDELEDELRAISTLPARSSAPTRPEAAAVEARGEVRVAHG